MVEAPGSGPEKSGDEADVWGCTPPGGQTGNRSFRLG